MADSGKIFENTYFKKTEQNCMFVCYNINLRNRYFACIAFVGCLVFSVSFTEESVL